MRDRSRYANLFEDADVKRWYENTARGSPISADVQFRRLGSFCEHIRLTPKELAGKSEDELFNLFLDYVSEMQGKGFAGSYINNTVKDVKAWLAFKGVYVRRKVKIEGATDSPSLKDERTPSQEELKKIFLSGDKKIRVAAALVSQSGLRLEVLGDYLGRDGLRLGDLPEVSVEGGQVKIAKVPTVIVVRKSLNKARHQYFTFLSEEGCEYLREYLEERLRDGEALTKESPIITPKTAAKPFIRTINIGDAIRKALRQAGFKWRPYVLRSYFDTQMMLGESKGLLLRDYRTFFMGHKGDIEHTYTVNRSKLNDQVVDDMRTAYTKCQVFLQTKKPESADQEELDMRMKRQFMLIVGYSQEELDKMGLSEMSNEKLREAVRERLLKSTVNNGNKQRVIPVDQVAKHLGEGWEYVDSLPDGTAIIKLPYG
jgi:site-specific recombinase XerD